jgi:hypothetical protein
MESLGSKIKIHAIALLAYSIITLMFTHPLVLHVSDSIIVDNPKSSDASQFIWNVHIFKKNVSNSENPFSTSDIYYPGKANLWMHTYAPATGMFALLFTNNFLALNIFLLTSFLLSAHGAFLLARRYLPNSILAFACGFIFSFSSYKLMHIVGHYHLMLTATVPYFILFFLDAFEYRKNTFIPSIVQFKNVLICSLLFFSTILCDYYSAFFIIYFVLLFSIYNKFLKERTINWRSYKTWGIIASVLAFFHILIGLLRYARVDNKGAFYWQADLMALFTPHTNSAFYGKEFPEALLSIFNIARYVEGVLFLGFLFLLFTVLFFKELFKGRIPENLKPLLFLSLVFFCIMIPGFKIAGKELLFLPTSILHFIPFFNNIRCSPRIFLMFSLFFPIVVLYVVNTYPLLNGKWKNWISLLILAGFILEYRPIPFNLFKMQDVPSAIHYLSELDDSKVLMPVPVGLKDGLKEFGTFTTDNLFYQTIHGKKILGGYTSRSDEKTYQLYLSDSVMVDLLTPKDKLLSNETRSPELVEVFFKKFNPGIILIAPKYRGTNHERYVFNLIKNRKYSTKEMDGYLIVELN